MAVLGYRQGVSINNRFSPLWWVVRLASRAFVAGGGCGRYCVRNDDDNDIDVMSMVVLTSSIMFAWLCLVTGRP